jgi:hypothetical protein
MGDFGKQWGRLLGLLGILTTVWGQYGDFDDSMGILTTVWGQYGGIHCSYPALNHPLKVLLNVYKIR